MINILLNNDGLDAEPKVRRKHEEKATLGADCRCLKDMVGNIQLRVEDVNDWPSGSE